MTPSTREKEQDMKEAFLAAKKEIEKFNASFEYVAGIGEIAADIWHNHATIQQRTEIMNSIVINTKSRVKNINACYKVIQDMIA